MESFERLAEDDLGSRLLAKFDIFRRKLGRPADVVCKSASRNKVGTSALTVRVIRLVPQDSTE